MLNMPIKILHTSDLHLEAKLDFLGPKSAEHRKQLLLTFKELVNRAISEKYDVVLIAGDLFDTPFPSENVKALVSEELNRLARNKIYVAVIAGNHDRLEQGSVYFDKRFSSEFVHIFNDPANTTWEISALDLTVYGVSLLTQKDNSSPLSRIKLAKKTKNQIALLHGSLEVKPGSTNNPIKQQELLAMNFNYVALGDWHSTKQIYSPSIWYCGSPELINIDQIGAGNFLSVLIDDKTKVTPVRIGKKEAVKLSMDITGAKTLSDLLQKWRQIGLQQPNDKFVQLTLTGTKDLAAKFSEAEIKEYISEKVYYLKLNDTSSLLLSDEQLSAFPEEFLLGKYIRLLQKKKGEDYSQNRIIDEAIQLGVRLLQNQE